MDCRDNNADILRDVKKEFFAYRNGVVADTLRRAGDPHRTLFGLNVPQIADIARRLGPSARLARMLWEDSGVRESRLLACYLFPPEETTRDEALRLMGSVVSREEADMLAFRLLKRLPFARELAQERPEGELGGYMTAILLRHLG